MNEDRRRAERLASSARILWHVVDDDFLQLDRVRDVSATGAFVVTEAIAAVGARVRFDLQDDDGERIADGTAEVMWTDPAQGMGIRFVDVTIDARSTAAAAPPPLPPRRPQSAEAEAVDTGAVTEIEPLDVRGLGDLIIGIDLGTTNTCAAWVADGRVQIIEGRTGGNTIPSMVSFDDDGRVHVGQRATDRQVLHPERTVYASKRLIGRTFHPALAQRMQAHFAYPLGEAEGQRFGVRLGERVVSMDAVAARVLEEVRSTAEEYLGREVAAAVITVPAYFSEVQREAVRRAARVARLTVHRIVNEPTAAAVAYGHRRGEEKRIAVWDFGGGTFDFSVVDIRDERYEVVATGGDNFVGGADLDDQLASLLLERFIAAAGLDGLEPTPQQIARLREAAEQTKRALSVQTELDVQLPEFTRAPRRDLAVHVTREDFEARAEPLVRRTVSIAQGVLLSAGIVPDEIDEVVLVGGSTRVPAVQAAVAELFGRRPSKRINPDEAVALGAGLIAHEIVDEDAPMLLDLLPMTVGCAIAGRRFEPLVRRNARLPCEVKVTRDVDARGRATVPLFQGEADDASRNEYLSTVVVEEAALAGGGRVEIHLAFDEHCVMTVEAYDAISGAALELTLDRDRPRDEILRELGDYEGPKKTAWELPPSRIGEQLGKAFPPPLPRRD